MILNVLTQMSTSTKDNGIGPESTCVPLRLVPFIGVTKSDLLIRQAVKLCTTHIVDYRSYWLYNWSFCDDDMVSYHILKVVKKLRLQIKTYRLDSVASSFILSLLTKFKLPCNTNQIYEVAVMRAMPRLVVGHVASSFISGNGLSNKTKELTTTVSSNGRALQLAQEHTLKYSTSALRGMKYGKAIAKANAAIFSFTQPNYTTMSPFVKALFSMAAPVKDVYNTGALSDTFNKDENEYTCYSLCQNYFAHQLTDQTSPTWPYRHKSY